MIWGMVGQHKQDNPKNEYMIVSGTIYMGGQDTDNAFFQAKKNGRSRVEIAEPKA